MTLAFYGPGGFDRELVSFARGSREVLFISDSEVEISCAAEGSTTAEKFVGSQHVISQEVANS